MESERPSLLIRYKKEVFNEQIHPEQHKVQQSKCIMGNTEKITNWLKLKADLDYHNHNINTLIKKIQPPPDHFQTAHYLCDLVQQ